MASRQVEFNVDMHCDGCARAVTGALKKVKGVTDTFKTVSLFLLKKSKNLIAYFLNGKRRTADSLGFYISNVMFNKRKYLLQAQLPQTRCSMQLRRPEKMLL
jgi:copper chaperone CopZ